ncbi:MAG: DegQ family serine endoprotease [Zetaproteobacteria bacterium]|nr:DegQ family serine endoprotease [Zetaproteobacteria bacterium]
MFAIAMPESFADLAEQQRSSVVNISTTKVVHAQPFTMPQTPFGPQFDDMFREFFRHQQPQQDRQAQGMGTGFILSHDGYVVTNFHVVDGADEVTVKTSDGKELKAEVIGMDSKLDLALLKVDAKRLHPIILGDSDALRVGDWVVAIGNPFGLEQTVTAGIVSAKGRVIGAGPYDSFIQTDAAINPGNSGGPLFNVKGEVIGINTAIYSRSGGNNGIGFAIPINLAKSVFDDLKESGHVQRARLGVAIRDLDDEMAKGLGLESKRGALVPQVEAGSAADKAGIQAGDVIVALDDQVINNAHELPIKVASHKPGDRVMVKIIRNGKTMVVPVVVEEMPEEQASNSPKTRVSQAQSFGMALGELSSKDRDVLRTRAEYGVVVREVQQGSQGEASGIQRGDVIVKVNGHPVKSVADFEEQAKSLEEGQALRVLIDRRGDQVFTMLYPSSK